MVVRQMVQGFLLSYFPKDAKSRTLFHITLFGRIQHKNHRGRKYGYYDPGMLDNKRFSRLMRSRIFVLDLDGIDVDLLNIFGEIKIEPCERDESELNLRTAKEFWRSRATEENLVLRDRLSEKRKK